MNSNRAYLHPVRSQQSSYDSSEHSNKSVDDFIVSRILYIKDSIFQE